MKTQGKERQGQEVASPASKRSREAGFPEDPPSVQFSSVQSLSCVWLFVTPWTAARQASLSLTNSQSLLKLMSTESVMPSNHLRLCRPLLLPPSILPSIRVFSSESALHIGWPKYWSFNFSIGSSNEYSGLISFRMTLLHWKAKKEGLGASADSDAFATIRFQEVREK